MFRFSTDWRFVSKQIINLALSHELFIRRPIKTDCHCVPTAVKILDSKLCFRFFGYNEISCSVGIHCSFTVVLRQNHFCLLLIKMQTCLEAQLKQVKPEAATCTIGLVFQTPSSAYGISNIVDKGGWVSPLFDASKQPWANFIQIHLFDCRKTCVKTCTTFGAWKCPKPPMASRYHHWVGASQHRFQCLKTPVTCTSIPPSKVRRLFRYLDAPITEAELVWNMLELSVICTAILHRPNAFILRTDTIQHYQLIQLIQRTVMMHAMETFNWVFVLISGPSV